MGYTSIVPPTTVITRTMVHPEPPHCRTLQQRREISFPTVRETAHGVRGQLLPKACPVQDCGLLMGPTVALQPGFVVVTHESLPVLPSLRLANLIDKPFEPFGQPLIFDRGGLEYCPAAPKVPECLGASTEHAGGTTAPAAFPPQPLAPLLLLGNCSGAREGEWGGWVGDQVRPLSCESCSASLISASDFAFSSSCLFANTQSSVSFSSSSCTAAARPADVGLDSLRCGDACCWGHVCMRTVFKLNVNAGAQTVLPLSQIVSYFCGLGGSWAGGGHWMGQSAAHLEQLMQRLAGDFQPLDICAVDDIDDRFRVGLVIGLPISPDPLLPTDVPHLELPNSTRASRMSIRARPKLAKTVLRATADGRHSLTVRFLKVTVSMLRPIVGTVRTTSPSLSISAPEQRAVSPHAPGGLGDREAAELGAITEYRGLPRIVQSKHQHAHFGLETQHLQPE